MKLINKFMDSSIIEKLLFIFFILLIISLICQFTQKKIEGFQEINKTFIENNKQQIDDKFYSQIYDLLFFNKIVSDYEVGNIISNTNPTENSIILDIGSKTGYFVNLFTEFTPNVVGIEKSPDFINKAIERYPRLKENFLCEDILNNHLFENNSFTHIFCLNNDIYQISNKKQLFENCYSWLYPGGYLIIDLLQNPELDTKKNIINLRTNLYPGFVDPTVLLTEDIKFKDFKYKPSYKQIELNKIIFSERFSFNNGIIKNRENIIYFDSIDNILKIAKYLGFIVLKQYSIKDKSNIEHFIYFLQKPN